ncbi:MAG: uracil-DNA glycosylase family protein [Candidatus Sericytochromatia bacterium]
MQATDLRTATDRLLDELASLSFGPPVTHVYNPLVYARALHDQYLARFAAGPKRVVFLGMNPGPWGMAQTGVPFGEVAMVRDWLGLTGEVEKPAEEHPKRPIDGLACRRSEVSGSRLWGAIRDRWGEPEAFFEDHFVANYCPLSFMEASGLNRTPDKLPASEREPLYAACDRYLRTLVEILDPTWVVGVGAFAEARANKALAGMDLRIGRVPHPSPASPAANRGWAEAAAQALQAQGLCSRS